MSERQGVAMRSSTDESTRCTITCPVCQAYGALLRHDIRASLVYFCQRCQHEWQIDPSEEPLEPDDTMSPGPLRGHR